jgi:hypothetical protein
MVSEFHAGQKLATGNEKLEYLFTNSYSFLVENFLGMLQILGISGCPART